MKRLFLDEVRRMRGALGVIGVSFVIPLFVEAVPIWFMGPVMAMIYSQGVALDVGVGARVIRTLPIDVRGAARATWLAAVVPTTIICLAALAVPGFVPSLLDPFDTRAGVAFAPVPLFVLLCVAIAATTACIGLVVGPRTPGLRQLLVMLPAVLVISAAGGLTGTGTGGPSALGVALVAAPLVAVTVLSYILAPRAFAHASGRGQRRALTSRTPGEPLRLGYGATGAIEPWIRTFLWSLGLGLLLAVPSLAIPRAFDPLEPTIAMALLASMAVYMSGVIAFVRWTPTLRAFRVLPISTNRLPLLLLGQPACVHAGAIVGAGAVWLAWPADLAWLGPSAVLLVVFFGVTLSGLSVMCWFGLRKEAHLPAVIMFTLLAGAVARSQVRGAERGAAYYALLDSVGAVVGVGVALATVGYLVLRAAISRRGSLYRSS